MFPDKIHSHNLQAQYKGIGKQLQKLQGNISFDCRLSPNTILVYPSLDMERVKPC